MYSLEATWQDVRYGARTLGRAPAFTTVVVALLALGIGANTAIFSVIDVLMFRTLPVQAPEQLVELLSRYPGEPRMNYFGWKIYEHYRDQNHVFSDLIGTAPARFRVTAGGSDTEPVEAAYVTGTFFRALGIQPTLGRLIAPEDGQAGAGDALVVVSWAYWQRRFHMSPTVVGERILLEAVPATIVGVAPRGFTGLQMGRQPDLWVPAAVEPRFPRPGRRPDDQMGLQLMARLKPGVSIEQARAEMRVLDRGRVEEMSARMRDPAWRVATISVEAAGAGFSLLRDHFGRPLLVLMAMVGVLLLIACTNIASLLLARAAARRREMAIRVALGAGRGRLVRQLLAESLLLAAIGGALGVALARFGAIALVRSWPLDIRWRIDHLDLPIQTDLHVLLFTAGAALVTGVLFGLAPAWFAFALVPASSLRGAGPAGETKAWRLFGKGLVVAQVAFSVALLGVSVLFVGHMSNLRSRDLGFEPDQVLVFRLDPAGKGYSPEQLSHLYQELLERLAAIPGVRSATTAGITPADGAAGAAFVRVEGVDEPPEARRYVSLHPVGPKYFETLGTRWIAGRDFRMEDAARPPVAIVNQAFERHYFGNGSAVGRRFKFDRRPQVHEIVGVAADAKYSDLRKPPPRTVYLHAFQEDRGRHSQFALRTSVPPARVSGDVQRAVRDVLKTVPVVRLTTLSAQLDESIVLERLTAKVAGAFGAVGALLAACGLYGLLAYTVTRRTSEIGIRMALGATRRDVTRMVVRSALTLVFAGLALGAPMAIWSRRFGASLIETPPVDSAWAIAFAALAMGMLTLAAAAVPARRAARVEPAHALRHE